MRGVKDEAHPAARHAAQHPETEEMLSKLRLHALDQSFGKQIRRPGNNRLNRTGEISCGRTAQSGDVLASQGRQNLIEDGKRAQPCPPLGFSPQQIFLGDHFEDRTDVLGHATVNQHEAVLQLLAHHGRSLAGVQDVMSGHQLSSTDAAFGIALRSGHAFDEFDARPDAAGILPAAARTAQPFPEYGAGQHETAFFLVQSSVQRGRLTRGPHAQRNHRSEQVGGYGQPRSFGNSINRTDKFKPAPGAHHPRDQISSSATGATGDATAALSRPR